MEPPVAHQVMLAIQVQAAILELEPACSHQEIQAQ
jgi:hypothetical protein